MTEKATVATVCIVFLDGERDEGASDDEVRLNGNLVGWVTEDVECARTLQEQLCALLGDVSVESILPPLTHGAMQQLGTWWPGTVTWKREDL